MQMQTNQKPNPQITAKKVCTEVSSRKKLGDGHFLPASFALSPGIQLQGRWGKGVLLFWCKKLFLFFSFSFFFFPLCYRPMGLRNASLTDYQSQGILSAILWVAVIKVRTPDVWTSSYQQLGVTVGLSQREKAREMFTGFPGLRENHSNPQMYADQKLDPQAAAYKLCIQTRERQEDRHF